MSETKPVEESNLGLSLAMEGVVEKHPSQIIIRLLTSEDDCNTELWKRMGSIPFYQITMYDSYLNNHITGYVSKEILESRIKNSN